MHRPFEPAESTIAEPARATPLYGAYDVVVLGGGPAGIAAAASAARHGARTLLVERYGFLGGMGTAAGVTNFCGLHANVHGEIVQVVHGIADDLLARMRELGGLNEPHLIFGRIHAQAYDTAAFKCAADALLLEAGVELLFHAFAVGVVRQGETIEALLLETKSGRVAVRARTFIDCSGDGDLAHFAGVATEKGDAAGALLYPTLMFRVGNVDAARAGDAWRTIPERMDAGRGRRRVPLPAPRRDRPAAEARLRVAGQRHPAEERRRQRHRRHRCALALRRRGGGPAPGGRLPALPARQGARLRGGLRARDRAAARHPRDPAAGRRGRADAPTT